MAHGLQVYTGSGASIIQIDSSTSIRNYAPVISSSGSFISSSSFSYETDRDLTFINVSVSSGSYKTVWAYVTGTYDSNGNVTQEDDTLRFEGRTNSTSNAGSAQTVSYYAFKNVQDASSLSGNYGLQVYNSSNQIAFDSRQYTAGSNISVLDYKPSNTYAGSPVYDSPITTNLNRYVGIDRCYTKGGAFASPFFLQGYIFANNYTYNFSGSSSTWNGIYHFGLVQAFFNGGASYTTNYNGILVGG